MAHKSQMSFFERVKHRFPHHFQYVSVLDMGSMDINGNNRYLFKDFNYTGIDLIQGPNVDIVCKAHEYDSPVKYDVVISSECFEHDKHYEQSILNAVRLTKSGGLFLFTCASTGRKEHGTPRTTGWASPGSASLFDNYYKNLTVKDIVNFLDCDTLFENYLFEYTLNGPDPGEGDLYFYGIKK